MSVCRYTASGHYECTEAKPQTKESFEGIKYTYDNTGVKDETYASCYGAKKDNNCYTCLGSESVVKAYQNKRWAYNKNAFNQCKFKEATTTEQKGGDGGNAFEFRCPQGFVQEFHVRSGSLLDSIGGKCSENTSFGPYGSTGGAPYYIRSKIGFGKADVRSGSMIDKVVLYDAQGKMAGSFGGEGGAPSTLSCGYGGRIMGIKGRSGQYVDKLGFICGKST